ncbi:effector-associated constant component EACC1 [Asanoa hainanensis]|uniref:effector-associated constant component EACC1 n=1 Tax=Asanoa hainanensis TaxID=560556 RepID=UPI003CCC01C6
MRPDITHNPSRIRRMLVSVVDDEGGDELYDLYEWIRADHKLLKDVVRLVSGRPAPGEMSGAVSGVLEFVSGNGELLSALVGAITGWITARASTRRSRVRVKFGEHEIELDSANLERSAAIIFQLHRAMREDMGCASPNSNVHGQS